MAAKKYFIGSCINFIVGRGQLVSNGSSATHYKMSDALKVIGNRKDLQVYKIRKTSKGRDYVIGHKISYVGNDNNIVDTIEAAKKFDSQESAAEYAANCSSLINELNMPQIYDTEYNRKCFVETVGSDGNSLQEESLSVNKELESVPTVRRNISPSKRARIFSRDGKICAICGKPLNIDDFTVDHIKPLSKGGTYNDDNLRAAHERCNKMKDNMMDNEFFELTNDIASYQFINNFDYNSMLAMARGMVRGAISQMGI